MLDLQGITKRFGATEALADVSLSVAAGEVVGLAGHNGAGKSTLIKIVAGAQHADAGSIRMEGHDGPLASAQDAYAAGIRVIHQDAPLVPAFDTIDNCWLGRSYPRRFGRIDRAAMRSSIAAVAATIAPDLPLDVPVMHLSTAERQFVRLLRALADKGRLLILDEPTAALPAEDAAQFYAMLDRTRETGTSIILVTHRLDEMADFCDRAVVLRDGRVSARFDAGDLSVDALVRAMGGERLASEHVSAVRSDAPPVLEVENLRAGELTGATSFKVHPGEVVALYGLSGSGRSSLLNALWGAESRRSGRMRLTGASYAPRSPREAVRAGVSYVPADRHRNGLFADMDLVSNKTLPLLSRYRRTKRLPLPSRTAEREDFSVAAGHVSLVYGRGEDPARTLSGGNQQKLLFSRWATRHSKLMLLDEPTEGVDIVAKATIRSIVRAIAADGNAVLVSTSDRDEAIELGDRVLVFFRGEAVADLSRNEAIPEALAAAAQAGGTGQ
ncbi:sugar ABC transporter ATP-binding protein [Consotaella aegiceratis]|uniref:sugar ABC transporter ATP-binding protein n=1 Tax=Consotaella aegiceratis TaxID=3097961 RepID=UPI002F3FBFDC